VTGAVEEARQKTAHCTHACSTVRPSKTRSPCTHEMKSSSPLQPAGHRWLPSSHHVHVAVLLALLSASASATSAAAAHAAEGAAKVRSSDHNAMSRLALVHGDEADDVVSLAPLPSCRKIDELCYQGTQQDIANVLKTDPLVRGHNRIATPQTHHLASDVGKRRWLGQLFLHCQWPKISHVLKPNPRLKRGHHCAHVRCGLTAHLFAIELCTLYPMPNNTTSS
jgi:hypothetical protein